MTTLEIRNLYKEFETPNGTEVAVDHISFEVEQGEFISIVGPSGCGKTTTLRCISGLEKPSSGSIIYDEHDITTVPPEKRGMAMMFQDIALLPHMTIFDNIAFPLKLNGSSAAEIDETVRENTDLMQISDMLDKKPTELSGGQQQRAALARTIVQSPDVFLLDEPLSDLDAKLKAVMRKEIQKVHEKLGKPTIYVTHDQKEALTMSDRILILNDGHIEQIGSPKEVYQRPENIFAANFVGNPSMNFIEATANSVDSNVLALSIEDASLTVEVDTLVELRGETPVVIGIRPRDVTISRNDNGLFSGEIQLIEPVDEFADASIVGPQGEIRSTISVDSSLEEGETVNISLNPNNLHVFDGQSEELLAKSTGQK